MIFLAFLLPLAIYLLILGSLNNREHPVMVPGTWDFAGILFAGSGFLLFGGPAILGNFNERARLFWMLGEGKGPAAGGDGGALVWMLLTLLYFIAVLAGSAFLLWQHRHFTSIYNIQREAVERAIHQACIQVEVDPLRSGELFLFGLADQWANGRRGNQGIQAPHYRLGVSDKAEPVQGKTAELRNSVVESAVLEIESFDWLRHVSLRWDPADANLRTEIEGALRRVLQQVQPPDYVVGFWMTLLSQSLFILIFFGGFAVLALRMFWP